MAMTVCREPFVIYMGEKFDHVYTLERKKS